MKKLSFIIVLAMLCDCRSNGGKAAEPSPAAKEKAALSNGHTQTQENSRTIAFAWRPPKGPKDAYALESPEDQHRIVLFGKTGQPGRFPVVVGLHGQPARGKLPRDYRFQPVVTKVVGQLVSSGVIPAVVLVLPAFRYYGQNWPDFDLLAFKRQVASKLKQEGIEPSFWLAFGHSGAAGCGGEGLNQAHRLEPRAVGFFDTCLGKGWQEEITVLREKRIAAVNIHSVETAGFRPRQHPEYQSGFDFGRAYGPLGLRPSECPLHVPGQRLRDQAFRCATTEEGSVRGFVVDTGEGESAHEALLPVALEYFLREFTAR